MPRTAAKVAVNAVQLSRAARSPESSSCQKTKPWRRRLGPPDGSRSSWSAIPGRLAGSRISRPTGAPNRTVTVCAASHPSHRSAQLHLDERHLEPGLAVDARGRDHPELHGHRLHRELHVGVRTLLDRVWNSARSSSIGRGRSAHRAPGGGHAGGLVHPPLRRRAGTGRHRGAGQRGGTSQSAVSRRFVTTTAERLAAFRGADLSEQRWLICFLDGLDFAGHTVVGVAVADAPGQGAVFVADPGLVGAVVRGDDGGVADQAGVFGQRGRVGLVRMQPESDLAQPGSDPLPQGTGLLLPGGRRPAVAFSAAFSASPVPAVLASTAWTALPRPLGAGQRAFREALEAHAQMVPAGAVVTTAGPPSTGRSGGGTGAYEGGATPSR